MFGIERRISRAIGRAAAAFAVFAALCPAQIATAADGGWVGAASANSLISQMRSESEFPIKHECRNGSTNKAAFKVEMRIVTGPNPQRKQWALVAGDYPFQPGKSPAEWGNWSRISSTVLTKPGSGGKFYCSLFHHKQAGSYSPTPPPLSRKTAQGFVTIN